MRRREPKHPVPPRDNGHTWRTICASLYPDDIEAADRKVYELQCAGLRRMSRSELIRIALERTSVVDVLNSKGIQPCPEA